MITQGDSDLHDLYIRIESCLRKFWLVEPRDKSFLFGIDTIGSKISNFKKHKLCAMEICEVVKEMNAIQKSIFTMSAFVPMDENKAAITEYANFNSGCFEPS